MKIIEIDEHLDPDQELGVELECYDGGLGYLYLKHSDYLKIKAAFEEHLND